MNREQRNDKLQEIKRKYQKLEGKFIEYLNENREPDEAKLVPIIEEHYWQMAYEKLKDQNRHELAEELCYEADNKFKQKRIGCKKIYEHNETRKRITVTYTDIIRYGNKYVWRDFGLVD